ncbi:uncharacterized protein TRIREDRAFT_111318 [Trichoderma reesei QM6a]|uniref:Predicted protein n=1 Tax=Hypocrea jecorina (strain QM6a) TaxID=431241 RepID=G0RU98_HYPJQ|nr:uncharacterized protein TRIREDRAFT_111318 [Trichoderma reesei QM6a]EGR45210.1 predicted protein [Trichoderma reesei QM6a]
MSLPFRVTGLRRTAYEAAYVTTSTTKLDFIPLLKRFFNLLLSKLSINLNNTFKHS